MARTNLTIKRIPVHTHEGAVAKHINPLQQLRRSVLATMLWDDQFYESGQTIAQRITDLVSKVKPEDAAQVAIEAREKQYLRHAPLLVVKAMAALEKCKPLVAATLERVIQRADELAEFVSIYWAGGKRPLSNQIKKGLANAFTKFNEYQLAKYNFDRAVKLKDVLFLTHPKPKDKEQEALWKRLVEDQLTVPETWEVLLSATKGENKKAAWERLLTDKKLGNMALLRNLRNMTQASVNENLILAALKEMKTDRLLPFRFVAAANACPQHENAIEETMLKCLEGRGKLLGKTILLVDVSGSMDAEISNKSQMRRVDAATGLAILLREICEKVEIYSFSESPKLIPARRGFALRDAISQSQPHGGTDLGRAVQLSLTKPHDRLIVISDEQTATQVPNPLVPKSYMINVASYQNGVGYGAWNHIDGWSDSIVDFITKLEDLGDL